MNDQATKPQSNTNTPPKNRTKKPPPNKRKQQNQPITMVRRKVQQGSLRTRAKKPHSDAQSCIVSLRKCIRFECRQDEACMGIIGRSRRKVWWRVEGAFNLLTDLAFQEQVVHRSGLLCAAAATGKQLERAIFSPHGPHWARQVFRQQFSPTWALTAARRRFLFSPAFLIRRTT